MLVSTDNFPNLFEALANIANTSGGRGWKLSPVYVPDDYDNRLPVMEAALVELSPAERDCFSSCNTDPEEREVIYAGNAALTETAEFLNDFHEHWTLAGMTQL